MTTLVTASLVLVTLAPVLQGYYKVSGDQGVTTERIVRLLRRLADIIEDEEDSTQRPQLQTVTFVTPRQTRAPLVTTVPFDRCVVYKIKRPMYKRL